MDQADSPPGAVAGAGAPRERLCGHRFPGLGGEHSFTDPVAQWSPPRFFDVFLRTRVRFLFPHGHWAELSHGIDSHDCYWVGSLTFGKSKGFPLNPKTVQFCVGGQQQPRTSRDPLSSRVTWRLRVNDGSWDLGRKPRNRTEVFLLLC